MKLNKKLSAAITLSLMLGVYGSASAASSLYGTSTGKDVTSISATDVVRGTDTGVCTNSSDANILKWNNNSFVVQNGTWDSVYGGKKSVAVTANNVTITGTNTVVQYNVYGGDSSGNIAGGDTAEKGNKVTISGGTIGDLTVISGVYGGRGDLGAANNAVNINGGTINTYVYGGSTSKGDADSNTVTATGDSEIKNNIYGGYVNSNNYIKTSGNATNNKVIVSGNSNIFSGVYGGKTANDAEGDAIGNRVNINGTSATEKVQIGGSVYGGESKNGLAKDNTVGTLDKRATNFTAGSIYGGWGTTGAEGNDVHLGTGANVTTTVFGGYAYGANANATKNTVNVVGAVSVARDIYGNYARNNGSAIGGGVANVAIINSNIHAGNVYGGYGYRAATGNAVNITGAGAADDEKAVFTGTVYGGQTENGTANDNKVGRIDSTGALVGAATDFTAKYVYGGQGATGASNNEVYLGNGVNVERAVYGGFIYGKGNANDNQVTISGNAEIGDNVYGGYVGEYAVGNANNNIVNVSGGKMSCVQGGSTINKGNAEENRVTVTGGEMFWVIGGFSGGDSTAPESFYVSSNIVEISGTTVVRDDVTGGCIQDGEARNNNAIVTGGTIGADVHGGEVAIQGDATGNTVSINGVSATNKVQITGNIYGGKTAKGEANNNKVGKIDSTGALVGAATNFKAKSIYGGDGATGVAGNEVWLGAGVKVEQNVYGGFADGGDATSNIVSIKGTGTNNPEIQYEVYGGYSRGGAVNNNKVGTESNVANNFTSNSVYGGNGETGAEGNEVWLGAGVDTGAVYGGDTDTGDAASNKVNINGNGSTYVGNVIGGCNSDAGDATSNEVKITGSDIGEKVYGGAVEKEGNVTSNKVTITDSIVGSLGSNLFGYVYGGSTQKGNATSNEVTISGSSEITNNIYGGYTKEGTATSNSVNISGNSNITKKVNGGYVYNGGAANQNTVVIEGGNTGSVTGGEVFMTALGYGNTANFNTVTISGGEIVGDVTGGAAKSGNLTRVKGFANSNNI